MYDSVLEDSSWSIQILSCWLEDSDPHFRARAEVMMSISNMSSKVFP